MGIVSIVYEFEKISMINKEVANLFAVQVFFALRGLNQANQQFKFRDILKYNSLGIYLLSRFDLGEIEPQTKKL